MKIAEIVYGIAGGGAPNVALSLTEQLQKKGHTIHFIRINIPYNNEKEKTIVNELDNKGIKHFILNRKPKKIGLLSIYQLYRIFKKEKYDIIHSHLLIPDIYSAIVGIFLIKKPIHVITVHNTVPYHKSILLKTIFRKSVFVKCSPAIKEIGSLKKENVIPNGINFEKFTPNNNIGGKNIRKKLNLNENSKVLVSIGNLRKQKNQIVGIEMMDILINRLEYKNIYYLICGHGDEENNLKNKVAELNLTNHIHFLGLRNDIPDILRECDYFFNFSLWEGLPLAVIEAFASGITTILSPIAEHKAITSGISHCYIVDENTPESFASTLKKLIKDQTILSHSEVFKQRESVLKTYSIKSFSDSYEKLFMSLLKKIKSVK